MSDLFVFRRPKWKHSQDDGCGAEFNQQLAQAKAFGAAGYHYPAARAHNKAHKVLADHIAWKQWQEEKQILHVIAYREQQLARLDRQAAEAREPLKPQPIQPYVGHSPRWLHARLRERQKAY